MTFNKVSTQNRLNLIADYLDELDLLRNLSVDEICNDIFKYRTAERLQELVIQASLDINRHLLTELYRVSPESNSDVFLESGRVGILPQKLSERLAEAGKFRNFLVHQYEKIDARTVAENVQLILADYKIYIEYLNRYLNALGEPNGTES